jgi:hypothetical protein
VKQRKAAQVRNIGRFDDLFKLMGKSTLSKSGVLWDVARELNAGQAARLCLPRYAEENSEGPMTVRQQLSCCDWFVSNMSERQD